MTIEEAVAVLDAIMGDDTEGAHIQADAVLVKMVPEEVKAAYERLKGRARGFWYA